MFRKKNLTLKILLFLIFTDILETLTHFCFKKSAIPQASFQIEDPCGAFLFVKASVLSPFLWMGLFSVLLTFIVWSTVLSKIDLSVAVPVCSFSYIFVPLVSLIFLGEQITLLRWLGILFVLAGVILVSASSREKEKILQCKQT